MSHGPQHWKSNCQGKDCLTVQRITTNIIEVASTKRNLMSVGGHTDTPADLVVAGNTDAKCPCLNVQTVLMRTPTQTEFVECWSETLIRNGIPPAVVDDPLFRKTLVTVTSRMGQTAVCMGKGTALGKKDTSLSYRHTFTRKIIPVTDKRLHEDNMARLKPKMQKVGGTIMSDG